MEYLNELVAIGAVLLLGCMSPGPDFVAVTSQALIDRRAGLRVATGIAMAIACWAALSVFGLTVLLARVAWLYGILRWVGAGYLVWLGVACLRSAARADTAAVPVSRAVRPAGIARGYILGITNPKAAVFFSSLFVTLLPARAPAWVHAVVVCLAALTALGWFALVAAAFSTSRVQRLYRRLRRYIDGLTGTLLIAIGLHMVWSG